MSDAQLGAALAAISSASSTIADNDSTIKARSQRVIAIIVVVVWGVVVLSLFAWSILGGLGKDEFVCSGPASAKTAIQCTNGWTETKDQLKDVFAYAVVPFVTLILGFYFGQSTKSADPV